MSAPCFDQEHCSCVRSVVRCKGIDTFPAIPKAMRGQLSRVDLRGSRISTVDAMMFQGFKMGTVVDLRDQMVETSFCSIRDERVSILYDREGCASSKETKEGQDQETRPETTSELPTRGISTNEPTTKRRMSSSTEYLRIQTTAANYSWRFTQRRRGPGVNDVMNTTARPISQTSTQKNIPSPPNPSANSRTEKDSQDSTTSQIESHREYVLIILIVVSVSAGVVVVTVVVCYCCCCYVDTHCKCCLTHRSRNRRFSGESIELFSHQVPENLPNLRYRAKEL